MNSNQSVSNIQAQDVKLVSAEIGSWVNILAFLGIEAISVPSLLANVLVLATILSDRKLRSEPTYMSMSVLAVADISHCFISILPISFSIMCQRTVPSLMSNHILLNLTFPAWYLTCLSYCTIAANRMMILCYPELNEKIFSRKNTIMWLSSWPILVLVMVMPLIVGKCCTAKFHPETWQILQQAHGTVVNDQICVCYFMSGLTTLLSCICYSVAFAKVRNIKNQTNTINTTNHKSVTRHAEIWVLVQFILLTVVFTFAWIMVHLQAELASLRENMAFGYVGLIGYATVTAINPVVYFSMNVTFRCAAVALLKRTAKHVTTKIVCRSLTRKVDVRRVAADDI